MERILKKYKIFFTPYHGRTLTGGAARKILDNVDAIMDELIEVAKIALRKTRQEKGSEYVATEEEMIAVLEQHRQLLKAQDLVYAGLRKIDPTNREMEQTRKALGMMERLWVRMEFSKTPKAHLLFDHAADEQVRWGGLGDKIEDPLEKRHQDQKNLYDVIKRIPNVTRQFEIQNKREWALSNPISLEVLDNVYKKTDTKEHQKTKKRRTVEEGTRKGSSSMGRHQEIEYNQVMDTKRVKKEGTRTHRRMSLSAQNRWKDVNEAKRDDDKMGGK